MEKTTTTERVYYIAAELCNGDRAQRWLLRAGWLIYTVELVTARGQDGERERDAAREKQATRDI